MVCNVSGNLECERGDAVIFTLTTISYHKHMFCGQKAFFFIKSISISTIFPLWCLSPYKWLKAAHVQNRQDFSTLFFPKECINRKQIWHQKLWKINIIAFSKTLSKVSFISSPHCHKRSNKNVFLFPAKRPPHVLRYPHNSFLLHLKQKEHFLLHFQGQCHGIYMSTKLQIRKENRNKVGRVPRNVGRYEESVNGDLWESLRELWIGQP